MATSNQAMRQYGQLQTDLKFKRLIFEGVIDGYI